jgi:hypothetical protein
MPYSQIEKRAGNTAECAQRNVLQASVCLQRSRRNRGPLSSAATVHGPTRLSMIRVNTFVVMSGSYRACTASVLACELLKLLRHPCDPALYCHQDGGTLTEHSLAAHKSGTVSADRCVLIFDTQKGVTLPVVQISCQFLSCDPSDIFFHNRRSYTAH